jgi:hypothetical protein
MSSEVLTRGRWRSRPHVGAGICQTLMSAGMRVFCGVLACPAGCWRALRVAGAPCGVRTSSEGLTRTAAFTPPRGYRHLPDAPVAAGMAAYARQAAALGDGRATRARETACRPVDGGSAPDLRARWAKRIWCACHVPSPPPTVLMPAQSENDDLLCIVENYEVVTDKGDEARARGHAFALSETIHKKSQRRVHSRVRPVGLVNCAAIQASASERQAHRQSRVLYDILLEHVAKSLTRRGIGTTCGRSPRSSLTRSRLRKGTVP